MRALVALFLTSLITVPAAQADTAPFPFNAVHPGRLRQRRVLVGTGRTTPKRLSGRIVSPTAHPATSSSPSMAEPPRGFPPSRGGRLTSMSGVGDVVDATVPVGLRAALGPGHGLPARRPGCGESAEPGPPTGLRRLDAAHDRGFGHVSGAASSHRRRALTADGARSRRAGSTRSPRCDTPSPKRLECAWLPAPPTGPLGTGQGSAGSTRRRRRPTR